MVLLRLLFRFLSLLFLFLLLLLVFGVWIFVTVSFTLLAWMGECASLIGETDLYAETWICSKGSGLAVKIGLNLGDSSSTAVVNLWRIHNTSSVLTFLLEIAIKRAACERTPQTEPSRPPRNSFAAP